MAIIKKRKLNPRRSTALVEELEFFIVNDGFLIIIFQHPSRPHLVSFHCRYFIALTILLFQAHPSFPAIQRCDKLEVLNQIYP